MVAAADKENTPTDPLTAPSTSAWREIPVNLGQSVRRQSSGGCGKRDAAILVVVERVIQLPPNLERLGLRRENVALRAHPNLAASQRRALLQLGRSKRGAQRRHLLGAAALAKPSLLDLQAHIAAGGVKPGTDATRLRGGLPPLRFQSAASIERNCHLHPGKEAAHATGRRDDAKQRRLISATPRMAVGSPCGHFDLT